MRIEVDAPLHSDPQLSVGGYIWLERTDGRTLWRQRLQVAKVTKKGCYVLTPVSDVG